MSAKSFSLRNLRQANTNDNTLFNGSKTLASFGPLEAQHQHEHSSNISDVRSKASSTPPVNLSASFSKTGLTELTKNSKYCVLKLPATPAQLENEPEDEYLVGLTDETTSYSMVASQKGVYIWKYNASEKTPQVLCFNSNNNNSSTIPLGTLVSPIAGVKEPGIITVIPDTGVVTYWESVGSAFANELLEKKQQIVHQIKLYGSEHIEYIENIEPAGIVAATNVGRFILITYRDATGKPSLRSETMKTSGSGFFATIKDAITVSGSRRNVTSIKPGRAVGRDERHALAITRDGNLMVWDCFRTGQSHLLLEANLRDIMLQSVYSSYPLADTTFNVHDMAYHIKSDQVYVLGSFVDNQATHSIAYFLFTFAIEQNVLKLINAYQLKSVISPSSCRPKLLLPKPFNTIFVLFSDAVVLVDTVSESPTRWEDTVTFLAGVEAFAFGKEDLIEINKKVTRYPSVIAMTKQAGILRIERYSDNESAENSSSEQNKDLNLEIAKTKIEQAIFYSDRDDVENPIDFDFRKEFHFDSEVLDQAFSQVSNEIVGNTSPYLPPTLLSPGNLLEWRWKALNHMGKFLHQNFPNELNLDYRLMLLWDLEKLSSAKSLWEQYNNRLVEQENNSSAENVFPHILTSSSSNSNDDKVRDWFTHNIKDISILLFQASLYSAKNKNKIGILEDINNILLAAVSYSAYSTRASFGPQYFGVTEQTVGSVEPWTGSSQILAAFSHQYKQTVEVLESLSKGDQHYMILSEQLVHLVSTLCHTHCDRIAWLKETGQTDDQLPEKYESTRGEWIHNLVKFGQQQMAQQISEKLKLYKPLAEILGDDYRSQVKLAGRDTVSSLGIISKLRDYIKSFGYDFAAILFQYYVDTQQFKSLLVQFPQYSGYLERFLASGNFGRFSWIHQLLANKHEQAASTLLDVATNQETNSSNRRLQLSIARLSALASTKNQNSTSTNLQQRVDSQLEFVEIQDIACNKARLGLTKVGDQVSIYVDQVSKLLKSHSLNQLQLVLHRIFVRLSSNHQLTANELVDLLTLSDVDDDAFGSTGINFFLAFKLINLSLSEFSTSQAKINEKLIWQRLFFQDDWSKLNRTENKSDNIVEQYFSKTVLYQTLVYICSEGLDKTLDMNFVTNPEKAIWDESTEEKRAELVARYSAITDTGSTDSTKTGGHPKNKSVLGDVKMVNELLHANIKKHNFGKWAPAIYSQVEKEVNDDKTKYGQECTTAMGRSVRVLELHQKSTAATTTGLQEQQQVKGGNEDIEMKDQKDAGSTKDEEDVDMKDQKDTDSAKDQKDVDMKDEKKADSAKDEKDVEMKGEKEVDSAKDDKEAGSTNDKNDADSAKDKKEEKDSDIAKDQKDADMKDEKNASSTVDKKDIDMKDEKEVDSTNDKKDVEPVKDTKKLTKPRIKRKV